jgi:glycosyltransferase involved in cell wall biosynthesis
MKVLSVYYTHKPGGFCKRLYRLLNAASSANDVHYLCLDPPPGELSERVQLHQIPFPGTQRSGLFFWALFTLWCPIYSLYTALKVRPDRYIVFGAYYSSMLIPARLLHRATLVLFARSLVFKIDKITEKPEWVRNIAAIVEKIGFRNADVLVCMTESMASELRSFVGSKIPEIRILPNDVPRVSGDMLGERSRAFLHTSLPRMKELLKDHSLVVGTSGVLDKRKNIGLLLETFIELAREFSATDIVLVVAGDGPLRKEFVARVRAAGVESIGFTGWVDDMSRFYRSVDIILHPSVHEGMPNSVLEAFGYGLPVLAADIPEMREMLGDEGLLFDPGDSSALSETIRKLLNDPNELDKIKGLCSEAAERFCFDWDLKACKVADLIPTQP